MTVLGSFTLNAVKLITVPVSQRLCVCVSMCMHKLTLVNCELSSLHRYKRMSEPWDLQPDLHQPEGRVQVRVSQWLPDGPHHRSLQGRG